MLTVQQRRAMIIDQETAADYAERARNSVSREWAVEYQAMAAYYAARVRAALIAGEHHP
ncbi:MAG TPA: hypothetical protein VNM70_10770 [Burkholderiales bacterium]|jgi:hypothetical protein|nr:hypothetical protein [Burkholderiales bacterium]